MTVKPKQTMAQNKLLLLYLLRESGIQLSELQIVRTMDDLGAMRYFDLKECLFELEQNKQIESRSTPRALLYGLTESGERMLDVLLLDLRLSLRQEIDAYLAEHREELQKESQLVGEYIKLRDHEYRVTLKGLEQDATIFEINLIVYSRQEAQTMVEKWKDNAIGIYKDLILRLS